MGFQVGAGFSVGSPKGATHAGAALVKGGASDPLADVEYTGDLAADSAAELSAMGQAYRDRAQAEASRFRQATDSEFWFAVCFTSREEKETFLKEFGLDRLGGLSTDKYIDGRALTRALDKREGR